MAEDNRRNLRRPTASRTASTGVGAWLWGASLFTSIMVAGLHLSPGLAGRAILGLIAVGFVMFAIARASVADMQPPASSCAHLLRPRMRAMYWAGYALMFSGVALTALVSLSRWAR
ncbi:MAG: hypothetical protein AMJ81_10445 [Phycisphaerae bacterium SM23_33]|jgi:hypothetical protein|nr:MAG: hypothetical protein AMJ81_10445 [Phycisphaerae bacterium SM23_33]